MPERLGRYEIVRELGKGAMGVVYEGRDPNIGRRVAIKTARRDVLEASAHAGEMMARFLREARAAGSLSHPNIITIYDADEQEGIAYIAMEFLEGGDLRDLIDSRRAMDPAGIAELGAAICDALACAHARGVVHRDIKPANILMPPDAPLKVADFGIAHVSDSTLTQDGAMIGTPYYMSPEQFMGQKVDGRSDLFSVAVMLYELLTGEKPFTGEAVSTVMQHVIRTQPMPPHELNLNVSEAMGQVVMKALSKRPAERYQDGRAMAEALRESAKPNPDPAKLGLTPSGEAAATLVSGADHGAAATVVTTPPDAASTTQGSAAAPPGATRPPVAGAADSTVPGVLPQAVAPESGAAGAAPTLRERLPALYLGGGAVAAGIVVALMLALLLGEKTPEEDGGAPADENGSAATVPEQYFQSVSMQVWITSDAQVRLEWDGSAATATSLWAEGRVEPVPARVRVLALPANALLAEADLPEEGGSIPLEQKAAKVRITAVGLADGQPMTGEQEVTRSASEAEQVIGLGEMNLLVVRNSA